MKIEAEGSSETPARIWQLHVGIVEVGNFCNHCPERLKSQYINVTDYLPDDTTGVHCSFSVK
jgi:hypothetical protein